MGSVLLSIVFTTTLASPSPTDVVHLTPKSGDMLVSVEWAQTLPTQARLQMVDTPSKRRHLKFARDPSATRTTRFDSIWMDAVGLERIKNDSRIKSWSLVNQPGRGSAIIEPTKDLGHVHRLTGAADLALHSLSEGSNWLRGQGVVVGDIDNGVDIFHPSFFRADGGFFEWVDTDQNGVLDLGKDGVDINEDGIINDDEKLYSLGGRIEFLSPDAPIEPQTFDPSLQWLYVDTNKNGQRDYGPQAAYTEQDPAFGEPLFLLDDVDRNGRADSTEKLRRLKTSKFKTVVRMRTGAVYRRGENLIHTPIENAPLHGSAVIGILAGGEPELQAIAGAAPDADIVFFERYGTPDMPTIADIARQEGVNVLMHEYGEISYNFGDGTDVYDDIINELAEDGMVQLMAAHNFAGRSINFSGEDLPNQPIEVNFKTHKSDTGQPPLFAHFTVRWRAGTGKIGLKIQDPAGDILTHFPLTDSDDPTAHNRNFLPGAGYTAISRVDESERGTYRLTLFLLGGGDGEVTFDKEIVEGDWKLQINFVDDAGKGIRVRGHANDSFGRYGNTIEVTDNIDDAVSIAWPATADNAIAVGASVGNASDYRQEETLNDLRFYSGRGPTIDGRLGIDVVAPSDHYGANGISTQAGSYTRFDGTSGALPQVGAAVALLLQQEGSLSHQEVETLIHQSSTGDALTGTLPNPNWGEGRLSTSGLLNLSLEDLTAPDAIDVEFSWAEPNNPESAMQALPQGASDDDRFFWDFDYDGQWDETTVSGAPVIIDTSATAIKVRRWKSEGLARDTLFRVPELDPPGPVAQTGDQTPGDEPSSTTPLPDNETEQDDGGGGCSSTSSETAMLLSVALLGLLLAGRRRQVHCR